MNQIKITPELLAELKDKAEKATPAWLGTGGYEIYYDKPMTRILATQCVVGYAEKNDDAEYIAAANPQVVLALIAKIESLEKEADWLAAMLGNGEDCVADCAGVPCVCAMSDKAYPYKEEYVQTYCKPCWREAARKAEESSNG